MTPGSKKNKAWRQANPEKARAISRRHYLKYSDEKRAAACKWTRDNPHKSAALQKRHRLKMKLAAFAAYGGSKCVCCMESEICFLAIDHINGGGHEHRKVNKIGSLYQWLHRNKYPDGYRVLCHNCNHGRYINGGICPHVSKIVDAAVPS